MNGDYGLPVNLGNPEEHTITDFARIVQREIGELASGLGMWCVVERQRDVVLDGIRAPTSLMVFTHTEQV